MKFYCKSCGDHFTPSKETADLLEDGWISPQDVDTCEECGGCEQGEEISDFSDADSGL